ncbi:MAG: aminomethyl-transferring glycine dehydrogenase subunit GcvPB [Deltaproteobacteria bacterium]|nr:aminomethyl-transferring glycine dehydrogenase subunit GcvPB [Deltaproteobacteria bacterium]
MEEALLFEKTSPGRIGYSLPALDVPQCQPSLHLQRKTLSLPELSEPDVVRHYTRLAQWNFSIDQNFYPLGSCTMKYNPKINDWAASLPGFAGLHPQTPDSFSQGALKLMYELSSMIKNLSGLDAVSLLPLAGAQGEYTGLRLISAYYEARGEKRTKILIPDTAHGTNPASCSLTGFCVVKIPITSEGILSLERIQKEVTKDVAALMLTHPNTLGYLEENIKEISDILHEKGALLYCDGANFNAFAGLAQVRDFGVDVVQFNLHKTFSTPHGGGGPGSGPVAVDKKLEPFLPVPIISKNHDSYALNWDRPQSIGSLSAFYGNFGILVRAYTYMKTLGLEGMRRMAHMAILNANYIRSRLKNHFHLPYPKRFCLHETIFDDSLQNKHGFTTLDMAKRLLDYGYHPPTIYFPLVVHGSMMIEPTESESKQTLDAFCDVMIKISEEGKKNPDFLKKAPYTTKVRRVDEVHAARNPKLVYKA